MSGPGNHDENRPPQPPPGPAQAPAGPSLDPAAHGLREGLDGLRDLMDRLLADDGCPWDREQTLSSLRPYLIEEAYEVLESLDDPAEHRKELGDLLFQIVFHSALREREGHFDLEGVIEGIRSKMIRRHPHIFARAEGDATPSAEEVSRQWAALKAAERADAALQGAAAGENGEDGKTAPPIPNPLAGVPRALPALQRAWRLQDKAAAVGFDWPDLDGPRANVREEWEELERAIESGDADAIEDELGDLLFVLVRLGQKLGVESEGALRRTIGKFESRFAHVMRRAHEAGIDPNAAGLARLDEWWNEAKRLSRVSTAPGD